MYIFNTHIYAYIGKGIGIKYTSLYMKFWKNAMNLCSNAICTYLYANGIHYMVI